MPVRGGLADGMACLIEVPDRWSRPNSMGMAWATVLMLSQVAKEERADGGEEDGSGDGLRDGDGDALTEVSDRWSRQDLMGMAWLTVSDILSEGGRGGRAAEVIWYGCGASAWVSSCPTRAC